MAIKLYEYSTTRSSRVRWTLLELDVAYESREDRALFGSDELKAVHPLGKLPAVEIDGRALFESAAICARLADMHPEKGLIAAPGSWARALHDQWTAFVMTELEAHLWSTARNSFIYPEDKRVAAIIPQNAHEAKRALAVLEDHLAAHDYLVEGRFTVADIFAGYAVNWARRADLTTDFPAVAAYRQRLLDRPLCPYAKE